MMNTFRKQVLTLLLFSPFMAKAQNTIEPYMGYSIDLGNERTLSQVNIGLQYPVITHRVYQMLIGVRGGFPLNKHSRNDAAYTSEPSLPLSVTIGYEAKWYSCAISLGHRFRLISWADKNTISSFVNAGVAYQSISVNHDGYNKDEYTVLNPHRSLKKAGVFIGGGIQYRRELGMGAIFLQPEVSSPPLVESLNNYNYKLPVPFAISIGYTVGFKKRNK